MASGAGAAGGGGSSVLMTSLQGAGFCKELVGRAYASVWAGRESCHLSLKAGRKLLTRSLFHIGDDSDQPEGFGPSALRQFPDVDTRVNSPGDAGQAAHCIAVLTQIMVVSARIDSEGRARRQNAKKVGFGTSSSKRKNEKPDKSAPVAPCKCRSEHAPPKA